MPVRVLVVEDEPLLAFDIAQHLGDAGFEVVGPAATVACALRLIGDIGCNAAVLHVNLGLETAEPVADELLRRGTPFAILSGYSREQHPPLFHSVPSPTKPARPNDVIALLRRLTAALPPNGEQTVA